VAGLQRLQALDEMRADAQSVLPQVLFFENIENRETCRASDRVAAKRAEKLHPVVK
jgi:hypothetical protein